MCQGSYDALLIKAWEDWDEKHGSENDHPKEFPEKQVSFCIDHELFLFLKYKKLHASEFLSFICTNAIKGNKSMETYICSHNIAYLVKIIYVARRSRLF